MGTVLRTISFGFVVLASACSQQAPTTVEVPPPPAAAAESSAQGVLNVLTPLISAEVGKAVSLQATTANVTDEWAYVVAQPHNPDGSAIDWATTNLASRQENGVMDQGGAVHALMHKENGVWVVVEHVIAPTDVAWLDWAAAHNVPAGVIEAPSGP